MSGTSSENGSDIEKKQEVPQKATEAVTAVHAKCRKRRPKTVVGVCQCCNEPVYHDGRRNARTPAQIEQLKSALEKRKQKAKERREQASEQHHEEPAQQPARNSYAHLFGMRRAN